MDEAFDRELNENWADTVVEVNDEDVPQDANVITSHVVYKVKQAEDGTRKLKARLVPHGNRDSQKDSVRSDSSAAGFSVIRLLLMLTIFLGFKMGILDVKGAYLQSGPCRRTIYVRPPREWRSRKKGRKLWKLFKLPYGITEAGRQWQLCVEDWMLSEAGLQRVIGITQLYRKRDANGEMVLLVAKVTDDFLMSGTQAAVTWFKEAISARFEISKFLFDTKMFFNGACIDRDVQGNITLSMESYCRKIAPISISRQRRRQTTERATEAEQNAYRRLCGEIVWLGSSALPQASFAASFLQQRVSRMTVAEINDANSMLKELQALDPTVTFRMPRNTPTNPTIVTFSDASYNVCKSQSYGQSGIITGLSVDTASDGTLFYPLDWTSSRQKRVSHSSYGAEILACAAADDRGFFIKECLRSFAPATVCRHLLNTDSRSLYDTITTLHDGKEYRLRQTVERLRNSFESGELDMIRWIPGTTNVADALTKRCISMYRKLNRMCVHGRMDLDLSTCYTLDNKTWKQSRTRILCDWGVCERYRW